MRTVDVAEVIDGQKVSLYQCLIAFMAWLTLFLDGIDNQSIAYVAPGAHRRLGPRTRRAPDRVLHRRASASHSARSSSDRSPTATAASS